MKYDNKIMYSIPNKITNNYKDWYTTTSSDHTYSKLFNEETSKYYTTSTGTSCIQPIIYTGTSAIVDPKYPQITLTTDTTQDEINKEIKKKMERLYATQYEYQYHLIGSFPENDDKPKRRKAKPIVAETVEENDDITLLR